MSAIVDQYASLIAAKAIEQAAKAPADTWPEDPDDDYADRMEEAVRAALREIAEEVAST